MTSIVLATALLATLPLHAGALWDASPSAAAGGPSTASPSSGPAATLCPIAPEVRFIPAWPDPAAGRMEPASQPNPGPASAPAASGPSRAAVLEAIHQLENPRDLSTPGPCGELGAYQFRLSVWRMHTREPFRRALDRRASDRVAVAHYEWLRGELNRRGRPVSAYTIALAWNGGLGAVLRRHPPAAAEDYARRAEALASAIDRDARAE